MKATQVALENRIQTEQEKGALAVEQVRAQTNQTKVLLCLIF